MNILQVENLSKTYPTFKLDNVSFSLEKGYIMGFIGRNGAGKTTTLKSMLRFVHPDCGKVLTLKKMSLLLKIVLVLFRGLMVFTIPKKLNRLRTLQKSFFQTGVMKHIKIYLKNLLYYSLFFGTFRPYLNI